MWEARRRMLTGQLAPAKGWFIKSPKWPSGKYLFQENPASGQIRGQPGVWAQRLSRVKACLETTSSLKALAQLTKGTTAETSR